MNKKHIILIGLVVLSGCSGKPKLEAPPCPAIEKGGQAANQAGAAPVVSDDGRFTYLKFGGGQEIPNISALRLDGGERAADSTFDPERRIVTVFGIYPTIVLRSDKRIACIRNMNYDPKNPQVRATLAREDGAVW